MSSYHKWITSHRMKKECLTIAFKSNMKRLWSNWRHFPLCEQCPNTEVFWFVFARIRTEYGPKRTPYLDTFHEVFMNGTRGVAMQSSKSYMFPEVLVMSKGSPILNINPLKKQVLLLRPNFRLSWFLSLSTQFK